MAIAGVPATAFEMARILSHNFEYYRRSQLRAMSTEGKVRALSKLLKDNVGMALQGVGGVSPLFAIYDKEQKKVFLYFYDMLGAEFQILTHVATGSGSPVNGSTVKLSPMKCSPMKRSPVNGSHVNGSPVNDSYECLFTEYISYK
jgi:20S proteasome alpha/beta subunit